MDGKKNLVVLYVLLMAVLVLSGCSKKADESKPIGEVQAEADKMSVEQLRAKAMEYKDAIVAKKDDIAKITSKLQEIPMAEKLGEEAKSLSAEIDELKKAMSTLNERFGIYYNKLKEKGGEVTGLDI